MDIVGVCWIGNTVALTMFAAGLLVRAYAGTLLGVQIDRLYIPHGIMIGAGLVALFQIARVLSLATKSKGPQGRSRRAVVWGLSLNVIACGVMAAIAGRNGAMSAPMLAAFVAFAAAAALACQLVVGISAMHAGWFPAFATALIVLMVGILLGFPPVPLALLVGFAASGGPAFADLGFDLKTGWIVRGDGSDPAAEHDGRRQQLVAAVLGFIVAATFVWLVADRYFARDLLPPADRVYAATIAAGASHDVFVRLAFWALAGATLQALGGPARQVGVLLATGLLIFNPAAGWTALAALAARAAAVRRFRERAPAMMYVLAGGFLTGSALVSFSTATLKSR
jgi:uncharacterized oligopeptide transporter (OPT) family protein